MTAKLMTLPPKGRTISTPKGGWKKQTYYVVNVSVNRNNPIFRAIFYSGFLEKGGLPGAYAAAWAGACDETPIHELHFLEVVSEIDMGTDVEDSL